MNRQLKKSKSTQMRKRVWFQQDVRTSNGRGGFTNSWINFLPRWAAVNPLKAEQLFNYRSVNVEATHLIKTRGYLSLPTDTKWEAATWEITWSGILGTDVQIHYQINSGSWVEIIASTTNDGAYSWTIPDAARGENVIVRVMHLTNTDSYVLTDPYLIVDSGVISREVQESDRISFDSRTFEILVIEDLQEREFLKLITCKERR